MMSDLKAAMKNADQFKVGILRLLISAMQNESIALRGKGEEGELSDEAVIAVLKREAKKRKESIVLYAEAKRDDLKEAEEKELVLIKEYLPEELSEEEIKKTVDSIVASGDREFSSVIKKALAEFKGRADGKVVSDIIRAAIG
jgi:hypothetical protein